MWSSQTRADSALPSLILAQEPLAGADPPCRAHSTARDTSELGSAPGVPAFGQGQWEHRTTSGNEQRGLRAFPLPGQDAGTGTSSCPKGGEKRGTGIA